MKQIVLTVAFFAVILTSCNTKGELKDKSTSADTEVADATTSVNSTECYVYEKDKDVANLKLTTDGNTFTGDLTYDWFEKDRNFGTISGVFKGDTLVADYKFSSEGVESVREIIFVKNADGKLSEGYGDMSEKEGKLVFTNKASLKYDFVVFEKTACK